MNVAFVTTAAFPDAAAWSGTIVKMHDALQNAGCQVSVVHSLNRHKSRLMKLAKRAHALAGKRYLPDWNPVVLEHYAAQVAAQLRDIEHDVIFSPGTVEIAHLQADKPIVFHTDATFAGMLDYYRRFSGVCARSIRDGHAMEQHALSGAALAVYASNWAARSAIDHYTIDADKVRVVPFGANLVTEPDRNDVLQRVERRPLDRCRLLFVGVDWQRKGGDFAVEVASRLNAGGLETRLDVVGCTPRKALPGFVQVHGFVDKSTNDGQARLHELYSDSHFFILPTRAECYGVVFTEASAYGLPALGFHTGGVPTVVQDGINGWCLPLDTPAEQFCATIRSSLAQPQDYRALAARARADYEHRLSWSRAGTQLKSLLEQLL